MEYSSANFFPLYEEVGAPQPQKPSYMPKENKPKTNDAYNSLMVAAQQQQQPPQQPQYFQQPAPQVAPPPQKPQQSYMDKLFSKKKDLSKLLIFALIIAFGISICMVFQSFVKYMKSADKIVTLKQEFWVTVIYSIGLFLTTWIIKTLA